MRLMLRENEEELKMNQKLRFGAGSLPNVSWEEMVRRFRYLEELGFDSAWTGDHFVNTANP